MLGMQGVLVWALCVVDPAPTSPILSVPQALPYVALLIAMLFFIYAVIGMQVSGSCFPSQDPPFQAGPGSVLRPGKVERLGHDFPAKCLGY